jgi:hypothetical protein
VLYVSIVSFFMICPIVLLFVLVKSEVLFLLFHSFCVCFICKCMRDFTLWVLDGLRGLSCISH